MAAGVEVRDSRANRVGSEDGGVFSIYRPEDESELPKGRYYVKVGPNEFMEAEGR